MINSGLTAKKILLILYCLNVINLHAQVQEGDTTVSLTTLQELVVNGAEAIRSGNKTQYYPSKELRETMTTSTQLLAGLQIPELIVNPSNGDISISGGGKLSIRINGRPSSQTDLMSISAKDITKVEYISEPGIRYGDVKAVVDITVKRKTEGYGIVLNILQSPNRGWGDYTAALKYNRGRSEWIVDYHSNPMWRMDCYRNNIEKIYLPEEGFIIRDERGVEMPNRMVAHRVALQYSYAYKSNLLFNAQGRIVRQDDRCVSAGVLSTQSAGMVEEGFETEIAPFSSWQGDLDLYLHWKINSRHKIYFNLVPTVINSKSCRVYETDDLTLSSRIDNQGYSVLMEGVLESRVGSGMLSSGIWGESRVDRSRYFYENTVMRYDRLEGKCFVEWSHSIDKFSYMIGAEASVLCLNKPLVHRSKSISPRLFLRFTPSDQFGMNLSFHRGIAAPSSSQLNPVEQRIDRFQYSVGNPDLVPYHRVESKLEFDFNLKDMMIKLSFNNNYSSDPVMGAKNYEESRIIQSYFNSGYMTILIIKGSVRMPLFVKQLTLSVEGGWHRMESKGENYHHRYSQAFVNAQMMFIVGSWWFMAKYNNAYNELWGERIGSVNNNLLNIGVGYRYKSATFMAGIVNPIGNVSLKSRDLSAIAGYERTYHAASTNCLAWVGVSLNINKGKHRIATQKRLDNDKRYETIKNIQK